MQCIEKQTYGGGRFEGVMKMKDAILKAGNKYQIGGIPNHRVEEHLIVVKPIIDRIMRKGEGSIMKLMDIEILFFDSGSLRGVMNTLHMSQIPKEMLQNMVYQNRKTVISVKTPSGSTKSEEAHVL